MDWLKTLWSRTTRSESFLLTVIATMALVDLLSGRVFVALVEAMTVVLAMWIVVRDNG